MTTEDRETPADDVGPGDSRSSSSRRRRLRWWQELLVVAVVALVAAVLVKTFLIQPFYIPSESMEPGLVEDDRILVEKSSYWFGSPQRGDVVVFADPGGWLEDTGGDGGALSSALIRIGLQPAGGHLVKRVIGTAGDTIVCCDDEGHLEVNGEIVIEPYARPATDGCFGPMVSGSGCAWTAGPVPAGQLFVMGDNRAESADSSFRLCPPDAVGCESDPYVDVDLVVGKLAAVVWPLDRFDLGGGTDVFLEVPAP